jgi:hypothetical protein
MLQDSARNVGYPLTASGEWGQDVAKATRKSTRHARDDGQMPDWIERVWGLEPDGGDGSVEWGLTIFMVVAALAFSADAHRVRLRSASTSARTP